MIIPARWFSGGKGLDIFRDEMLRDDRLRIIHDFQNAKDCFYGVEIKGGVCYFLWNRDNRGLCKIYTHNKDAISIIERPLLEPGINTFVRHNEAVPILHKITALHSRQFSNIVSSRNPFGFFSNFDKYKQEKFPDSAKIYAHAGVKVIAYIDKEKIKKGCDLLDKYKIYIPKAFGEGDMKKDTIKPFIGEPNTCCTETYLVVGPFGSKEQAQNAISYIQTKFFHFLLGLKKITQNSKKDTYSLIPLQSFDEPWSDEKLYKKYHLTQEEIDFIESMVRPME